jgi:ABC-type oligopeptide transport system substrate-binding subunit
VENLFVGLTRFRHASSEAEPYLAERWEISPDGLTWTFHLRRDLFWVKPGFQMGRRAFSVPAPPEIYRPVIADDVVFALQRACDPATRTPGVLVLFIVEGCEELQVAPRTGEVDLSTVGAERTRRSDSRHPPDGAGELPSGDHEYDVDPPGPARVGRAVRQQQ